MMKVPLSYLIERAMLHAGGVWSLAGRNPDRFRIGDILLTLKDGGRVITVSQNGTDRDFVPPDGRMEFSRMYLHLSVVKHKTPQMSDVDVVAALAVFEHGFTLVQAIEALGHHKRHVLFMMNKLINQGLIMEYPIVSGPKRWITVGEYTAPDPCLDDIDTVDRLEWLLWDETYDF